MHKSANLVALLALMLGCAAHAQKPGPMQAKKELPATPSFDSFADLPASMGVRLPCSRKELDECATRIRLRQEVIVSGLPFKAQSILTYWEEDLSGTLARDALYKGVWLKGNTHVALYFGLSGTLLRDQLIEDIPCKGGAGVSLDEDDHLRECTLGASLSSSRTEFPPGTQVSFRDGTLQHIGDRDFPSGARLRLDEKGNVLDVH